MGREYWEYWDVWMRGLKGGDGNIPWIGGDSKSEKEWQMRGTERIKPNARHGGGPRASESIHKKRRCNSIAAYEQISDLFVVDLEH